MPDVTKEDVKSDNLAVLAHEMQSSSDVDVIPTAPHQYSLIPQIKKIREEIPDICSSKRRRQDRVPTISRLRKTLYQV